MSAGNRKYPQRPPVAGPPPTTPWIGCVLLYVIFVLVVVGGALGVIYS